MFLTGGRLVKDLLSINERMHQVPKCKLVVGA